MRQVQATKQILLGVTALFLAAGCGQGPCFLEDEYGNPPNSSDAVYPTGDPEDDTDPFNDARDRMVAPSAAGEDEWVEDWYYDEDGNPVDADGNPIDPGSINPEELDIPEDDPDNLDALHKCLAKWQNLPFDPENVAYRKIAASVTVGGYGNAINDTERTDYPELVLITAGVNVGGAPVYNLMNPNGYYCIKVNVNVLTQLDVNLHCNARLADSKVNVNVGSTQNDTTSGVGVHVLSEVDVITVSPEGDDCIR